VNGRAAKKKELSKRGGKPSAYRRVVTENVNGKAVVRGDETVTRLRVQDSPRLPAHAHLDEPGHSRTQQGAKV
jgi:hypothetical protein